MTWLKRSLILLLLAIVALPTMPCVILGVCHLGIQPAAAAEQPAKHSCCAAKTDEQAKLPAPLHKPVPCEHVCCEKSPYPPLVAKISVEQDAAWTAAFVPTLELSSLDLFAELPGGLPPP